MGVIPDKILESKNVYRLLVLLALASVAVNFFFPALKSHALPNTIAMYSIRPVNNFDKNLYNHADGSPTKNVQTLTMQDIFKGNLGRVDKFGDGYNAHNLNELQIVKYMQGCYGDFFSGSSKTAWDIVVAALGMSATDYKDLTNLLNVAQKNQGTGASVCTCIDDMYAASVDMNKLGYNWGYENAAWSDYDAIDSTSSGGPLTQEEINKFNVDTGDKLIEGDAHVEDEAAFIAYLATKVVDNAGKYVPPSDFWQEMNQGHYLANAYNLDSHADFTDPDTRKKYHEDITRLCIESAIPMHALAYEDTAPTALLAMIGQLLLILAAVQIHSSFVHADHDFDNPEGFAASHSAKVVGNVRDDSNQSKPGQDMTAKQGEYTESLKNLQWLKGVLAVGILVVLFWQSIVEYSLFDNTEKDHMKYRTMAKQHDATPVLTIFTYVGTFLAVFVTLLFEYIMYTAHREILAKEQKMTTKSKTPVLWSFHRNGNTAMVLKHIASDVPLIVGFSLLGIAVLMQSNVTATHSVIGLGLLLVIAGFMQHVSNVIKGLYTRICARLDARLVTQLTMYDAFMTNSHFEVLPDGTNVPARELNPTASDILNGDKFDIKSQTVVETTVRPVLQYFGYSRLYIFLVVLLSMFAFLFVAKDTTHVHSLHTMLGGQLIYFSIAFVFCNVGFDVLYELLPFMFEDPSTEKMRIFTILLYVLFFNLNQMLYFFRIPGA